MATAAGDEEEEQQLFWDETSQRYFKYDEERDEYYTDEETRAADKAAAQEAAEAAAAAAGGGSRRPSIIFSASRKSSILPPLSAENASAVVPEAEPKAAQAALGPPAASASAPASGGGGGAAAETAGAGGGGGLDAEARGAAAGAAKKASPQGEERGAGNIGAAATAEAAAAQVAPQPSRSDRQVAAAAGPAAAAEAPPGSSGVLTPHERRERIRDQQEGKGAGADDRAAAPAPHLPAAEIQAVTALQGEQPLQLGSTTKDRSSQLGAAAPTRDAAGGSDRLRRPGSSSRLDGKELPLGGLTGAQPHLLEHAAAASTADAALHAELEGKRKENQDLQEKTAALQRRIEELTVRLLQADQGMTDDQRLASLTRERDDLALQVRRLEEDIVSLEEALEAAAVEKETALAKIDTQRDLLNDTQLQFDNLLVDKELEIATLREQLTRQQAALQEREQQQLEIQQLKDRVLQYDKTFVQLKQLLLDVSVQRQNAEAEVTSLKAYKQQAEATIKQLQAAGAEDAELLLSFEKQQELQAEVVTGQERQLQQLQQQLRDSNVARLTYQQAFERLTRVLKEREISHRSNMEMLQQENKQLQTKVQELQWLAAPRWQRVFTLRQQQQQQESGGGLWGGAAAAAAGGARLISLHIQRDGTSEPAAAALTSSSAAAESSDAAAGVGEGKELQQQRDGDRREGGKAAAVGGRDAAAAEEQQLEDVWGDLDRLTLEVAALKLQREQQQVLLCCIEERMRLLQLALPTPCRSLEARSTIGIFVLHAAAVNCFIFLSHVHTVYVQPLAAEAVLANPRTVLKEQGFIRWLVSSVGAVASLGRTLALFVFYLRAGSSSSNSSSNEASGAVNEGVASAESRAPGAGEGAAAGEGDAAGQRDAAGGGGVLQQLEAPGGVAYKAVVAAHRFSQRLLAAAAACTLSSSLPLAAAEEAAAALAALLPPQLAVAAVSPSRTSSSSTASASAAASSFTGPDGGQPPAGGRRGSSARRNSSSSSKSDSRGAAAAAGRGGGGGNSAAAAGGMKYAADLPSSPFCLLPCITATLHASRAAGLLALAAACVQSQEGDSSLTSIGSSSSTGRGSLQKAAAGAAAAGTSGGAAAAAAVQQWQQLISNCTAALEALPPPLLLPPAAAAAAALLLPADEVGGGGAEPAALQQQQPRPSRGSGSSAAAAAAGLDFVIGEGGFGDWLVRCLRETSPQKDNAAAAGGEAQDAVARPQTAAAQTEAAADPQQGGEGGKATQLPSCEEAFQASHQLLLLNEEAPDILSLNTRPGKPLRVVLLFTSGLWGKKRSSGQEAFAAAAASPSFYIPAAVAAAAGRGLAWEAPAAALRRRLATDLASEKSAVAMAAEQQRLSQLLQQREAELKETAALAMRWQKEYSKAKPTADKYSLLEAEMQRILKEKTRSVRMLDAARRRLEVQQQEQQQLRTEKKELSTRLQELSKRLESLKKLSMSVAAAGGDEEQTQLLRNIIRKQELELLEVRLADACKLISPEERDAYDVLYLERAKKAQLQQQEQQEGEGEQQQGEDMRATAADQQPEEGLGAAAAGAAAAAQLLRGADAAAEQQQPRALMRGDTSEQQQQQQQQPASLLKLQQQQQTEAAEDLGAVPTPSQRISMGRQLLENYRQLQQAVLLHAFQIPLWDPSAAAEENRAKLRRYRNEHDALTLQAALLTRKVDQFFSRVADGSSRGGFGEHASLSVCRYMKQFADLSKVFSPAAAAARASEAAAAGAGSAAVLWGEDTPAEAAAAATSATRKEQQQQQQEGSRSSSTRKVGGAKQQQEQQQQEQEQQLAGATLVRPVMRLLLPELPLPSKIAAPQAAAASAREGGGGAPCNGRSLNKAVRKLLVTEEQLSCLYKKIAGI